MSLERLQIPYMTTAQRTAVTPKDRDMLLDTDLNKVYIGDGVTVGGVELGVQGAQGFQGFQGFQGNQGNQGTQGVQGNQGTQGVQGNQGTQGNQGLKGDQGNQGNQGNQGFQGNQGNQGFQGNQGNQGNQGFQGNQGLTGSGTQGNQGNQGNQGFQGNQGLTGTGTQGNQGNQGFQGNQGNQGATGSGTQGNQGNQGNQGFQGNQGNQGNQGTQGNQGNQGDQGAAGSGNVTLYSIQGNQVSLGVQTVTDIFAGISVVAGSTYEYFANIGLQPAAGTAGCQVGVQCSAGGATVEGTVFGPQTVTASTQYRQASQGVGVLPIQRVAGVQSVELSGIIIVPAGTNTVGVQAKGVQASQAWFAKPNAFLRLIKTA